jgi:hypothetical protein
MPLWLTSLSTSGELKAVTTVMTMTWPIAWLNRALKPMFMDLSLSFQYPLSRLKPSRHRLSSRCGPHRGHGTNPVVKQTSSFLHLICQDLETSYDFLPAKKRVYSSAFLRAIIYTWLTAQISALHLTPFFVIFTVLMMCELEWDKMSLKIQSDHYKYI